jgi:hypothetical protein
MDKENVINIYTIELSSDTKKNGIVSFVGKLMELEITC